MELNFGPDTDDEGEPGLMPKYEAPPQKEKAKTSVPKQKETSKPKLKHEKSMLTGKFKALLASNLKKHHLGKDIENKVEGLYTTKSKRDISPSTKSHFTKPVVTKPPPYYEKYIPLSKCEETHDKPTSNLFVKGVLYYDSVEDNPDY